jgi:hypothetical protein
MDKIVITGFGVKAPGVSKIVQFKDVLQTGIHRVSRNITCLLMTK